MGIDGESQAGSHSQWSDINGSSSSGSKGGSPQPGKQGGGINLPAVLVGGMLLVLLVGAAIYANNRRKDSPNEAEEIVFEPEVISLDNGSVKLNAAYTTDEASFLHADGEDEIPLTIEKTEVSGFYDVKGTLNSVQKVGVDGMDQGQPCTVDISHDVTYKVTGTFIASRCTFELNVSLAPTSSGLVGTGCLVDINFDPSGIYVAPRPDTLTFTKSLASLRSEAFSFYLFDVALPQGVNCPALSNP
jgi:hypothetical protein